MRMVSVSIKVGHLGRKPDAKPTIYEVLKTLLGREPTHAELVKDVQRILGEARQ